MFPARKSRGLHTKVSDNDIRQWVLGSEDNDLRSVHKPWVRTKYLVEDRVLNDQGKSNTPETPVDDAVVVQVLHTGRGETGRNTKSISLTLLSAGGKRSNVPKHSPGISFRKVDALAEAPKEFAVDSELESKVEFCP